jgi:hypothetical protein
MAAAIVFILIPVFAAVMEGYIINIKAMIIKDSVDMANLSAYNAMEVKSLSTVNVDINHGQARESFCSVLSNNMRLKEDMTPMPGSIAESKVTLKELNLYTSGLPLVCSKGKDISRPTVHSVIEVPIRPTLFSGLILEALGEDFIVLEIHLDSEIPINN